MFSPVTTKDPAAVQMKVQAAYLTIFPDGDRMFVPRVFGWVIECFTGRYGNYQAVDAQYHDFEHTLQGTLCLARLLRGRHSAGAQPVMTEQVFHLGLLAILMHDTGYLKERDDIEGTGAKYTVTHVARSADFAAELLAKKGYSASDILGVRNMISCTGVDAKLDSIPFQSELEKITGFALATADLLGQMAADDYLPKLPVLYAEFVEAAEFCKESSAWVASFTSVTDMVNKTPMFWSGFVLPKLKRDFGGLYRFLNDPYPSGPNWYVDRVEANMNRIRQRQEQVPQSAS
jgi:hypothetical protein